MKAFRFFVLSTAFFILAGSVLAGAPPTVEEQNWARWRGPYDTGMAAGGARTHWSETENVKWKIDVPGKGLSSPVIWGDKIFLTTAIPTEPVTEAQPMRRPFRKRESSDRPAADEHAFRKRAGKKGFGMRIGKASGVEHRLEVWCINKNTGETLWRKVAKTARPHEGYHQRYGSFASNSPVTDGKSVYAYFGSRGIFAYDLDGNLIWEKDLGVKMEKVLQFGEGTAPVLHGDTLLLKLDHQGDSVIIALDKKSGKELWRRDRDEMSSWSAPLVVEHDGRKQAVVSGTTKTRSYDFKTGEVIWEAAGLGRNVIPNPVRQNDTVLVMSGFKATLRLMGDVCWLVLFFVPALLGTLHHLLPFIVVRSIASRMDQPGRRTISTHRLLVGVPIYLLWYAVVTLLIMLYSPKVAIGWLIAAPFAGLVAVHYWRRAGRTVSLLYHEMRLVFGRIKLQRLRQQLCKLRQRLGELSEEYANVSPKLQTSAPDTR